jgi:hypothetical protein
VRVFDYKCPIGHLFEKFTNGQDHVALCECGLLAEKQLSAPLFTLEGYSGSFPGAASKWERQHEKAHADHVKNYGPDSAAVDL